MRRLSHTILTLGLVLLTIAYVANAESPPSNSPSEGDQKRPPHPEPRVIVNVLSVKGPHNAARVQHDARFGWKRIVRCYKANTPHQKELVTLDLVVSGEGSIQKAFHVRSDPSSRELEQCLSAALPGLSMPKAATDSTANLELKLAPGDPPSKGDS